VRLATLPGRARLPVGRLLCAYGTIIAFNACDGLSSSLVSPFLDAAGFLPTAIGALVAAQGVASLGSRLPAGALYHARRARVLTWLALLAQAGAVAAYPLAADALQFGAARVVAGLALGLGTTVNFALFTELLPPTGAGRLRAVGVYLGCQSAGYAIGNFLSGVAADALGYAPAFWLAAAFPLLALPLPQTPPAPPAESGGAAPKSVVAMRPAPAWPARLRAYREPELGLMIALAFSMLFLYNLVNTFFPLFALGIGLSLSQVGVFRGLQSLANAITRPFTGELARQLGYRRMGHLGLAASVALTAALPWFQLFEVYVGVFLLLGLTRGAALVSNSLSAVELVERRGLPRGIVAGLLNAAQDGGNIAGPVVGGLVVASLGVGTTLHLLPLAMGVLYLVAVVGVALGGAGAACADEAESRA